MTVKSETTSHFSSYSTAHQLNLSCGAWHGP